MDIFKFAAIAVTAALCALVLKKEVPALSAVLALAAGAVLLWGAAGALATLRGAADAFSRTAGLSPEVWKPVWKTVGIGVVAKLSSAVCKDAGEGGLASAVELAGTALALAAVLPLMTAVVDALAGLL